MVPKGFPFPRNGGHSFPTIFKSNLSSYPDASSLQKGFQTLSIEFGELIGKTCSLLQIIAKFADLNQLACRCVTTFKTGGKKNPEIPGKNPEIGGKNPEIGGLLFACFFIVGQNQFDLKTGNKNHEAILSHSLCAQKMSERLQSRAWSCSTLQAGLQLASDLPMSLSAFGDDDVAAMERELAQLKVSSWGWGKIKSQIQIAIHLF